MRRFFDKALSIFLSFAFVCGMAGCSFRPAQETSDPDVYVIGFSQVGSESDWRIANTKSMNDTFANNPDYELVMDNARQQQENQFAAVRRFILEGVDFIIIAPTVEDGWQTILTEVHDAGIPVIIMDSGPIMEATYRKAMAAGSGSGRPVNSISRPASTPHILKN